TIVLVLNNSPERLPVLLLPASRVILPSAAPSTTDIPQPATQAMWLVPAWISGVLLFYGYRLAGWMVVQRLRRTGVGPAPPVWQERLRALASRLRISQTATLLESCISEVPSVVGLWRPVILMPVGILAGLPAEQVEAILIHELAHIRRRDYLVNLLQS